ncbi:hypothetical protein DFH06DRAFT_99732 [Mycena polygramma]|nr:hypothetical protein DFH06DRAFT_99732 [Mycena polygramma]
MVLCEETDESLALLETLPEQLHVFVELPILDRDSNRIAEPRIYWSTHPTQKETSQIPPKIFRIRLSWSASVNSARWEKHHYDVAKSIQEECGFDPTTNAAAEALGLPLLDACDTNPAPSSVDVEDEWCFYGRGKKCRPGLELDPHGLGVKGPSRSGD